MLQLLCVKVAMKFAYFFPFIGSPVKHSYRMRKIQETNKQICLYFTCADFEVHETASGSSRSSANKFVNLCPEVRELPSNFSRHLLHACK